MPKLQRDAASRRSTETWKEVRKLKKKGNTLSTMAGSNQDRKNGKTEEDSEIIELIRLANDGAGERKELKEQNSRK
ncbi:hypothetical protein AVEN_169898-1 [Araneus ventricosus]|uniref:Uncharacterized protein n=1 Tax=Araneus ventricosus TaxID=182803 RepID=A0A4Y2P0B9_ARAVE|nr:hypothetical protein AVEN_169898-1 [Araneus ventricosus]